MDRIDRARLNHIAALASLSLSEAEAGTLTTDLASIVAYIGELDALDTSGVPATAHVRIERMPLRPDEVRPGVSRQEALGQAPRATDDGFAVPPFVDPGSGR